MRNNIRGVLTAVVTPFNMEGALNLSGLKRQIDRQLSAGNGIFCGGTNGEFFVLNEEEKIAVTRTCVETVAGRAPVVAHIGEISTRETIRLGKQIASLGVDAVSVITPYFVPLKQSELVAHYTAIADALAVPVFLYNIPARTGNTIEPATARALAEHPNIVGIKDSAGSYESLRVTRLRTELYSVAFSPAAVKKALQIMGEDVGESRYAVAFSEQQCQQIRRIVTTSLN